MGKGCAKGHGAGISPNDEYSQSYRINRAKSTIGMRNQLKLTRTNTHSELEESYIESELNDNNTTHAIKRT